jgi:hypothetical protein
MMILQSHASFVDYPKHKDGEENIYGSSTLLWRINKVDLPVRRKVPKQHLPPHT